MKTKIEIICPKCDWKPNRNSRWLCDCGFVWNTFDTGGECPACRKQWEPTMCLACSEWSLHLDWYKGLGDSISELERIVSPATGKVAGRVQIN